MDREVLSRLQNFSLSESEIKRVELRDEDVSIGLEEGRRSLIGRIFGEKRANF